MKEAGEERRGCGRAASALQTHYITFSSSHALPEASPVRGGEHTESQAWPRPPPQHTFTYCKDGGGLRSTHTHEAQTLCDAVKKPLMQKGEKLKKKKKDKKISLLQLFHFAGNFIRLLTFDEDASKSVTKQNKDCDWWEAFMSWSDQKGEELQEATDRRLTFTTAAFCALAKVISA